MSKQLVFRALNTHRVDLGLRAPCDLKQTGGLNFHIARISETSTTMSVLLLRVTCPFDRWWIANDLLLSAFVWRYPLYEERFLDTGTGYIQ